VGVCDQRGQGEISRQIDIQAPADLCDRQCIGFGFRHQRKLLVIDQQRGPGQRVPVEHTVELRRLAATTEDRNAADNCGKLLSRALVEFPG
jgi:hypothetical protein